MVAPVCFGKQGMGPTKNNFEQLLLSLVLHYAGKHRELLFLRLRRYIRSLVVISVSSSYEQLELGGGRSKMLTNA
jgi:hypothetical protein